MAKAVRVSRPVGMALLGLLLTACNIIPLSPSLSLTVQTKAYTTSTVDIPYSFATLSTSSNDGSAECSYVLDKFDPPSGGYQSIDQSQPTLSPTGTLTFALSSLLGVSSGSTAVDGLYRLSFRVFSGKYNQYGSPIAISYLSQAKTFTVHLATGPEIFAADPAVLNPNGGTRQTVVLTGVGFTDKSQVQNDVVTQTVPLTSTYVSAQKMKFDVNPSSLTPGSSWSISVTDGQGNTTPSYDIPIVGNAAISLVAPQSGTINDARMPIYIAGSYLGLWTTATVTDSAGNKAAVTNLQLSGSYLSGVVDLTGLTPGTGTFTVTNPDGSSASTPFMVYD